MKKRVPTGIGLAIILFFTAVFLLAWKDSSNSLSSLDNNIVISVAPRAAQAQNRTCRPRVFTGDVKLKGWYVSERSEQLFQVADEYLAQLPVSSQDSSLGNNIGKLKIIDIDPVMDKKLATSSEEKPATVTIKGYAIPCNGSNVFASVDYKDGMFKDSLGL